MDPVSHIALAHNLVRLRRDAGAQRGIVSAAVLGALSPDVDVFLLPLGWDRYMVAHESGTHSLAGAVVCAALAAALTRVGIRDGRFSALFAVAVLGAASHIWFDLFSGATIRLLWPFADLRFSNLGAFAMADPWVASLSLTAALAIWWRTGRRRQIAMVFAGALLLFTATKTVVRVEAQSIFSAHVPRARDPLVLPLWGSLTAYEFYAHDQGVVSKWMVDVKGGTVDQLITVPEYGTAAESETARSTINWETVRNFRRTHAFAFATASSSVEGTRVMWSDLRYCHPSAGARGAGSSITCAVKAGGEMRAPGAKPRLIVIVGAVVQER
jgi:membrane-bound metal-dependent hydrolase YbcI (DUF457 family)